MKLYGLGLLLVATFLGTTALQGQTVYVNAAATGTSDGSSWANAYADLQLALDNAPVGAQIWVAQGTYSPGSGTTDFFDLSNPGFEMYGGFLGTETMLSQRDFLNNKTILTGDVNGDDILNDFSSNRADNNLHVMIVDDTITNSTIIDGFFIEHGNTEGASGSGDDRRGGGILCFGSPIIRNCTFTQNYGYFASSLYPRGSGANNVVIENCDFYNNEGRSGGAIYLVAGGTISNCTFNNNFALYGGGVYAAGEPTTISHCTFSNTGGTDTRGAGVYGSTAVNLYNCTFDFNTGIWGTGVYATDVTNVDSCTFSNNTASSNGAGMLIAFGSVTTITNSYFEANVANNGGALYTQNDSTLLFVDNCDFYANSATTNGGAVFSLAGPLHNISNASFDLNVATYGGAYAFSSGDGKAVADRSEFMNTYFVNNIASEQGGAVNITNTDSVFMVNCQITDNIANGAGTGGGMSINASDTLSVYTSLMNCTFASNIGLLASNLATWENDATFGEATIVIQNSIFYDLLNNNYAIEAGTPTIISNGGNVSNDATLSADFTATSDFNQTDPSFIDIANFDYGLLSTSICIDAGVATNAPMVDINGDPRVGLPDIGAIEYSVQSGVGRVAQLNESLSIFPNPARETINFELDNDWQGNVEYAIVNSLGQVVTTWTATKNQQKVSQQINVQALATGNYILVARWNGEQARQMMVKL